MERDGAVPSLDTSKPNIARAYDYLLGGMDNFAVDRAMADQLVKFYPQTAQMCRNNRAFVTRAVTWVAQQGIAQFLDLGSGLPTSPSVHEAAKAVCPEARICYVDNDPMAVLHTRSLMLKRAGPGVTAADQDLGDAAAVLADPDVTSVISIGDPVCVILGSVLHFYDVTRAREIVQSYVSRVAPGSMLVISCLRVDDPRIWEHGSVNYTAAGLYNHTREETESFFVDLELAPPGLTPVLAWRGGMTIVPQESAEAGYTLGGVGLKPLQSARPCSRRSCRAFAAIVPGSF